MIELSASVWGQGNTHVIRGICIYVRLADMCLTTQHIHERVRDPDSYEWKQYHSVVGSFADGERRALNAVVLKPILWRSEDSRVLPAYSPLRPNLRVFLLGQHLRRQIHAG